MKKRKILIGALLATAVVSLAACTEKEDPTTGSTPSTTVTTGGGQSTTTTTKAPEVVMHKVEFYVENKLVDTKEVKDGWTAVATADPSKENHTFAGWYTDAALTTKYSFGKTVTGDLKLYAKFDLNQYTVTFKTNGGSTIKDVTVTHGNKLTAPANPTKADYTFAGWYTDEALTKAYNFDTALTGPLTLYANYTIAAYTVTFNTNGGSEIAAAKVEPGKTVTMPQSPTKDGYQFAGWYTDAELTTAFDATTAINANTTLYAKYNEVKTVTFMANGVAYGDVQTVQVNGTVDKPAIDPTKENAFFAGWYTDAECTNAYDFTSAVTANLTIYAKFVDKAQVNLYLHNDPTDNYAAEVTPEVVTLDQYVGGVLFGLPDVDDLEDDYREFAGWYTDKECTTPYDESYGIDGDTHLYAKWEETTKDGDFRCLASDIFDGTGTYSSDKPIKKQIFTIGANTNIRARNKSYTAPDGAVTNYTHSIQMNGTNAKFRVNMPVAGTLNLYVQNGSGSGASLLNLSKVVVVEGEENLQDTITIGEEVGTSAVELLPVELEAGLYEFSSNKGTIDIYDATFSCTLDASPIQGIEVTSTGLVDYIEGESFIDTVEVDIIYENETTEMVERDIIEGLTVDTTNLDFTTPGVYTVNVSYNTTEMIYGVEKNGVYTDSFDVVVYELDSICLGFNASSKGSDSAAGNGQYINNTVKNIYYEGDEYSNKYLTVTAITNHPTLKDENDNPIVKEFILPASYYTNDSEDTYAADGIKKTITYTYVTNGKTETASHDVYVLATTVTPNVVSGVAQVKVDPNYTGEMAAVVEGYNTFNTIQQAIDFLNANKKTLDGKPVVLELAAGTYNEKIEITIPNLTIKGAGKDVTKIEWDSLYGIADESGYIQTTDSTATIAVRDTAENFTITGVTVSNWYNSTANFQSVFGKGYNEHRALAMLVQADKFVMDDCVLLGYQDTIELFTGRQLIKNTLITGTTDFIFGTNNTTYFKNCEIRSIVTEDSYKNGGYITAFKGMNKDGAKDSVTYGAIFDECNFTADAGVYTKDENIVDLDGNQVYWAKEVTVGEAVPANTYYEKTTETDYTGKSVDKYTLTEATTFEDGVTYYVVAIGEDGKTAIARPWGAYAAVAVINSTLGGHISTTGWDGTSSRNFRYVSMNAKPTDETVKFVEYNNTGAGAITEAVAGCTILDATTAANYSDQFEIFGRLNGHVTYADNWAGDEERDATIIIEDAEGNPVGSTTNYVGATLTEKEVNDIIDLVAIPDKMKLVGVYTDNTFETELKAGYVVNETNTLYAKFEAKGSLEEVTYTYSGTELLSTYADGGAADKQNITQENLTGANSFLTVVGEPGNKLVTRSNKTYFELKGEGYLAVNFETGGTLKLSFSSTGSTNNSWMGVSNGTEYLAADNAASLTATTEDNVYEVVGTTMVEVTYTITEAGTYYINCPDTPGRGARIDGIEMTDSIYVDSAVDHTFNFSLEELIAAYGATAPADKTNIESQHLTGANSFLSLYGQPSNQCVVRAGNNCIEIKNKQLNVTFQGTGTITVAFASTGGSNTSYFAFYDAEGNALVATETTATPVDGSEGVYQVTGSSTYVTCTYTITEAGTYTIACPDTPGRGGRINAITMVDKF